MLNSKQIIFLLVLSIVIIFLLALFTLYDSSTTGLGSRVIRPSVDSQDVFDDSDVFISDIDHLIYSSYFYNEIPVYELKKLPPYLGSPSDRIIISLSDVNLSSSDIVSDFITVSYDIDKNPFDRQSFCYLNPLSFSDLSESGFIGGPINYFYNFYELLPSDKAIKDIYVVSSNPRSLFSRCNLAPAHSRFSGSGYFFEDFYKSDIYNRNIIDTDVSILHGFSLFNFKINPFFYNYERGEFTLSDIDIVINLEPKTPYISYSGPSSSQIDFVLNHLTNFLSEEFTYSSSFSDLESRILNYPNVTSDLLNNSFFLVILLEIL